MRSLLGNKGVWGMVAAALAVGTFSIPAAAKQSASRTSSSHTTAHKAAVHKSTHSNAASTKPHSTAAATARSSPAKASTAKNSKGKKSRAKKVKGQQAPTSDRISEIQQALTSKGALSGTPTGTWDDSTIAAVKKFQSSNGLTPTGKLDALTLQKLGLGSETAGVAPPIVPPDAGNRLRTSSAPASSSAEPR